MKDRISELVSASRIGESVTARGWVRTRRDAKGATFVELNDGSSLKGLQCVFSPDLAASSLQGVGTGASLELSGTLAASAGSGQAVELAVEKATVIGLAAEDYPLQKKAHSLEFLRELAHLRPRTNTFGAVMRVRSALSFAVHSFFNARGFSLVHTPIITASDCEGAGEQFQVTTLDLEAMSKSGKAPDYTKDFFGKRANLTVSGQLNGECYATALGRIYTFGPTFRAENSNTTRHLAEFWMIEPEVAFADLSDNMDLAEDFVKHLLGSALDGCAEDMAFFEERVQKGLIETLESVRAARFSRMSYTEAMVELEKAGGRFEFKPSWGCDLQSEHERFLTEEVARGPVIVTDYPRDIKAFYMKRNDDGKTVRAMDVLVPRLGEIIGGSEREADEGRLRARMAELGLDAKAYAWYLDLRRFGTVPHSGFGLGFERLVQYVTGMANIRDVIPFPRASGLAEY